jgi:hypothetical protein
MHTFNGVGTTIYGRARRKELIGAERLAAEQAGYVPATYQVIKWFVFLFMPVIPLGTYTVMKAHQKFWTTEFPRYSMVRADWDWRQVALHYFIAYGWIFALAVLVAVS